ncbi:MAG TPA: hypothetical protein VG476_03895, partial [Acidimicrobiales bacterium]|nr:hypothetical protein [Acidimicrobiales bacterium]
MDEKETQGGRAASPTPEGIRILGREGTGAPRHDDADEAAASVGRLHRFPRPYTAGEAGGAREGGGGPASDDADLTQPMVAVAAADRGPGGEAEGSGARAEDELGDWPTPRPSRADRQLELDDLDEEAVETGR